jgi:hypothetical protein
MYQINTLSVEINTTQPVSALSHRARLSLLLKPGGALTQRHDDRCPSIMITYDHSVFLYDYRGPSLGPQG